MKNNIVFRKATINEAPLIWEILQFAILSRKKENSAQWQNGYPNLETVLHDIQKGSGFVLDGEEGLICYSSISMNDEPAYAEIEGQWLSKGDYMVIHRVAVAEKFLKLGFAKRMMKEAEQLAASQKIESLKIDTNFDNFAMLKICADLHYQYCGTVIMNGAERKAFEKIIAI